MSGNEYRRSSHSSDHQSSLADETRAYEDESPARSGVDSHGVSRDSAACSSSRNTSPDSMKYDVSFSTSYDIIYPVRDGEGIILKYQCW